MINLISWLFFGLIVGVIAKKILPGDDPKGWIKTICIGVAGSYFGGLIKLMLTNFEREFSPSGLLFSVVGSIIFLVIWRKISER